MLQGSLCFKSKNLPNPLMNKEVLHYCYNILMESDDSVMLINMLRFYATTIDLVSFSTDSDEQIVIEVRTVIDKILDPQKVNETSI